LSCCPGTSASKEQFTPLCSSNLFHGSPLGHCKNECQSRPRWNIRGKIYSIFL